MEITFIKDSAETIYINHPNASYGIFCFNTKGDLFVNSDYGSYSYAWRSFKNDFKEFLSNINSDYMIGKFEINLRAMTNKGIPKYWKENLKILCDSFIDFLKEDLKNEQHR